MANEQKGKKVSASFGTGVVALVFLAVGYQTALFVHRAAVVGIAANRDAPDTVYVVESQVFDDGGAVAGGAFRSIYDAQRNSVGYKDLVYRPNSAAAAVYEKLFRNYMKLHNSFGVKGTSIELYPVMKELIAIRDSVRESRR